MKINFKNLSVLSLLWLVWPTRAIKAVCPVCTVAVAGGVGLSRWLGIDDSITGLWIGGLTVSMIAWNIDWFKRKNINFFGRETITVIAYYALVVLPLYYTKILGHPSQKCFCGLDKLSIGIIAGSSAFYFAASAYLWLKEKNDNKAYFPYQKVAMPVSLLIIISLVFYFLTK